jgi:hypothetical protein
VTRFGDVLKHAWNAFTNQDNKMRFYGGPSSARRPDRVVYQFSNERSIISSIFTRLSIDVASIDMRHVRTDDQGRYLNDIDSGLNNCLTVEANMDQAARHFRQDIAMTLFDKGVAALVPVDTTLNPRVSGGYDIVTLRVGEVVEWYTNHVRLSVYNDKTGNRELITLPKSIVSIIENPLYSVMNEPSSTLQRLLRKLALLDTLDENTASKKLDLLIQLPYTIKSETKRQQALQRTQDVEFQLKNSEYGIGYIDATDKVIQLNRPVENNLLPQIEVLIEMLYGQLGVTKEVMNGTADEKTMLNYWNRSVEPVLDAIAGEIKRKFLTKTARTQRQSIMYFRDPFKLVPVGEIAEIADKFTRNEIATSNEMRQVVGWKPHDDPKADQLINSNMPVGDTGVVPPDGTPVAVADPGDAGDPAGMGASFDEIQAAIDDALALVTANGTGPNAAS